MIPSLMEALTVKWLRQLPISRKGSYRAERSGVTHGQACLGLSGYDDKHSQMHNAALYFLKINATGIRVNSQYIFFHSAISLNWVNIEVTEILKIL